VSQNALVDRVNSTCAREARVLTVGIVGGGGGGWLLGKGEEREHEHEEHLERAHQLAAHGTLLNTHGFRRVKANTRLWSS